MDQGARRGTWRRRTFSLVCDHVCVCPCMCRGHWKPLYLWRVGRRLQKRQCLCSAAPCCWIREMNPVIGTRVRCLREEWCLQAGQDFQGSPLNGEPSQHVPGLGDAGGKRVVLSSVDAGLCGLDCVQMCGHKRCGAQPQGVRRGQLRPLLVVGWWLAPGSRQARHGEGLDCQPASHPMCVVV